jgi:hypothetical protein
MATAELIETGASVQIAKVPGVIAGALDPITIDLADAARGAIESTGWRWPHTVAELATALMTAFAA